MNLSVIIPCYNCSNHCEPLLNSITSQITSYEFEVICVIDNTTDNSYDIIDKVLSDANIPHKMKISSNGSTGLSRNDGIDLASGEYIMFIDDDDWFIGTDAFQSALDFAYKNPNNPICRFGFEWAESYTNSYFIWQYIWQLDFLKVNKFQNKIGGEDFDLMFRIYLKYRWDCCKLTTFPYLDKKLYHYNYPREGSILDKIKNRKC